MTSLYLNGQLPISNKSSNSNGSNITSNSSIPKLSLSANKPETVIVTKPKTDKSSYIATTAFVKSHIPDYLESNIASSMYAPLNSPHFSGNPIAPTPELSDNSINIATTKYVTDTLSKYSTDLPPLDLSDYPTTSIANATYAPIVSPNLSGTPTVPTPSSTDDSTTVANTAYVQSNLSNYVTTETASSTYATITNLISKYIKKDTASTRYAPIVSPNLTGTPTVPTPPTTDNSTTIANTAYVQNALSKFVTNVPTNISYVKITDLVNYLTSAAASALYLPINSPNLTGTPTVPTPPTTDNSTTIANIEYVQNNVTPFVPSKLNISTTNNTTDTNLKLVFSSGNGTQSLLCNDNLAYDATKNLLLVNNCYYLYGCCPTTIQYNTNTTITHTLTEPLYPWYTIDATFSTNRNVANGPVYGFNALLKIILPSPSIKYLGFTISFRKVGLGAGYLNIDDASSDIFFNSPIGSVGSCAGGSRTYMGWYPSSFTPTNPNTFSSFNYYNTYTVTCAYAVGAGNTLIFGWIADRTNA